MRTIDTLNQSPPKASTHTTLQRLLYSQTLLLLLFMGAIPQASLLTVCQHGADASPQSQSRIFG